MPTKKTQEETSFEEAMNRLEKIVAEMESAKMSLEDLLVRYEEGMKLVRICQERLTQAEQKIEIITRDHAGRIAVKHFEPKEPPAVAVASDSGEVKSNDDVSLF